MPAIFDQGAHPPCPQPFNLAQYVLTHERPDPTKTALRVVGPGTSDAWSYADLIQGVQSVAAGLSDMGLARGDRILLRLGNTVDFPLAFLGAIWAGYIPVPTSNQLTAPEVAELMDRIKPSLTLRDPAVACPTSSGPVMALKDIERPAKSTTNPIPQTPDTPAYIIFTSGTSGRPQAVIHAHRAIWARRMMWEGWYGLKPQDRILHAGAFNWTYTLGTGLLDPWSCGATALVPASGTMIEDLPKLLAEHEATLFAATPGVYRKLVSSKVSLTLPKLRHGLSAGEKLPDRIRAAWTDRTRTQIYEAFGMSECSTFISGRPGEDTPQGTLGRPQLGRRVAILGPEGPVEYGEPGTLAVATSDPGLMLGYLDTAPVTGDWFPTGDRAVMRPDGSIEYLGRRDDVLTTGGYRISPLEIEMALADHEDIHDCAVTEIEVKADTKILAALYTGPKPLDAVALTAYASERLASYKVPKAFKHVDALPRIPNGKLQRARLAALFEAEDGTT
jgi:acyl-coenzyme A synthetase/AMP-(fatty) acid ligase